MYYAQQGIITEEMAFIAAYGATAWRPMATEGGDMA
jgi:hypothetical protein